MIRENHAPAPGSNGPNSCTCLEYAGADTAHSPGLFVSLPIGATFAVVARALRYRLRRLGFECVGSMRRVSRRPERPINREARSYGIRNTWGGPIGGPPNSPQHANPSEVSLRLIPESVQGWVTSEHPFPGRSLLNRLIVGSLGVSVTLGRVGFQPLFLELWIFATTPPSSRESHEGSIHDRESLPVRIEGSAPGRSPEQSPQRFQF